MESLLKIPVTQQDHHLGELHSLIVLVEYGDFECPRTSSFAAVIEQLRLEFKANICYVYRHFPLTNIHSQSLLASLAAEAADQQHEFWSMWAFLTKNYDYLSPELYIEAAEGLGLDLHQFKTDMKREDLLERITKDFSGGVRSGVSTTPSIFINGQYYTGPLTYELIKETISSLVDDGQLTFL